MPDLFGSNRKGAGNDFVGYFYDLKTNVQKRALEIGKLLAMSKPDDWEDPLIEAQDKYKDIVISFLKSWNDNDLERYLQSTQRKICKIFLYSTDICK